MKPTILLTGGIASGKTYVSDYLSQLNAHVIDADIIARSLLQPNATKYSSYALQSVLECFGGKIFNNEELDRKKLRNIVFNDLKAKHDLEKIMHPLIFKEVVEQLQSKQGSYHLISIPLLKQKSPYLDLSNKVLVIEVDKTVQLKRVMHRDKIPEQLALKIIGAQISNQERRELASTIIINTNQAHTRNILKELDKKYSLAQFQEGTVK